MQLVKFIPIVFIIFGIFPYENTVNAGAENPKEYRVLAAKNKKLSIDNVKYYLKEGDKFINNGDFDKAKDSYLDARKLAKQLASFYSDLNSSFKGIDASDAQAISIGRIIFFMSLLRINNKVN